jgi:hypothetical protein
MSMLTDRISNTKDVMQRSKVLEEKIQKHQKYVDFLDAVSKQKQKMMLIVDAISALHQYDETRFPKADLSVLVTKLTDILNTFEAEQRKGQLHFLAKDLEEKSRLYQEKWHSFATSSMEDADRTLNSIRGLLENKQEIDEVIQSLRKISQLWPVSKKNVNYFDTLLQDAKSKVTRLQVSPSIQIFLEKVANQQASLSDITPEISDWLQQQDFAKNLIISFKRGS